MMNLLMVREAGLEPPFSGVYALQLLGFCS